jgi:hypothetical protein
LCYYLSGNPFRIDKYWVDTYKKGTLPNLDVSESEVEDLGFLLIETSKILMKDYDDDFFLPRSLFSFSYLILPLFDLKIKKLVFLRKKC